jgi:hypothetical protein
LHSADIDFVSPKPGSNAPDDTRHILVADQKNVPFGDGFQIEIVNPQNPGHCLAENGA